MTALAVLIGARAKIASEFNWVQFDQAVDKHGARCCPHSIVAKRWSIDGALTNVAGDDLCARDEAQIALRRHHHTILIFFNDSRTHEQVIDHLLDRTIAAER